MNALEPLTYAGGAFDTDALEEVRRRRALIAKCDAWLFETIAPFLGQRILEVGSGHGNLAQHMLDRHLVVCTDVDADSVALLRERFRAAPNVVAEVVDIADPAALELAGHAVDTVVSLNVFEHIEHDDRALRHARAILRPAGRVVLIVPAHHWLYGTMDRSIGHWRRYDKRLATEKLTAAGFEVETLRYMNALGTLGWLVNGRVLRATVPPAGQLKLFNRLMPLVTAVESRFEPPVGLSLLAVGRAAGA
jgi:SAM-dependent methyltransferase